VENRVTSISTASTASTSQSSVDLRGGRFPDGVFLVKSRELTQSVVAVQEGGVQSG
jgi:hypothetical protein